MQLFFVTTILILSILTSGYGQNNFTPEKIKDLVQKKIMLNSPDFNEKVELIKLTEKDEAVRTLFIDALLDKPEKIPQEVVELSQLISKGIEDKAFDSNVDRYITNAVKETDFKLRTAYVSRSAYLPISKKILSFQYGMLKKAIADDELYVEFAAFAAITNLFRGISIHKKYLHENEINFLVKASKKILPILRTDVFDRIEAYELSEFDDSALEKFPFRPLTREEKEKEIEEFTKQLNEIKSSPDHSIDTVEFLETSLSNMKKNLDKEEKLDEKNFAKWKIKNFRSIKEKNAELKSKFLSQYKAFKAKLDTLP